MSNRKTPWVKPQGSLPSDRIVKTPTPSGTRTPPPRGKNRESPIPKSKDVIRLESLVQGLKDPSRNKADPTGGCFCQARVHSISSYTPLCRNCGLILCELHQPFFICPNSSCSSPVLNPAAKAVLINQLEVQISDTMVREEQARQQAIRDAREAAGAFPELPGGAPNRGGTGNASGGTLRSHPVNQTHKVLSLNAKKGKVVMSSYTPSAPASRSTSSLGGRYDDNQVDLDVQRVPAPGKEVEPIRLDSEVGVYAPLPRKPGSSGRKKKKKGGEENVGDSQHV